MSNVKVQIPNKIQSSSVKNVLNFGLSHSFGRQVLRPAKSGIGGVKGHNQKDISFARFLLATACPGSPCLWPGSFTFVF